MYTLLGKEKLKNGETVEVGVVESPDAALADSILHLLAHKDDDWQFHMQSALHGSTDLLETRFYLSMLGGIPVSNVMTTESHGVGILGHVFTQESHRRKGICSAIFRRLMKHFQDRDGKVLTLGTGYESAAYWIYHSFGFRSIDGGFMRYSAIPIEELEQSWFARRPVRILPMNWSHWPRLAVLGARCEGEILRSAAWHLFGSRNLEGPVCRSLKAQTQLKGTVGVVLETETGAVTGFATVHPTGGGMNGWPGVSLLDFSTHSSFADHAGELLDCLTLPSGKVIAYVDMAAPDKAACLEARGFKREGTLDGFLRTAGGTHDVWLYGLTVE